MLKVRTTYKTRKTVEEQGKEGSAVMQRKNAREKGKGRGRKDNGNVVQLLVYVKRGKDENLKRAG